MPVPNGVKIKMKTSCVNIMIWAYNHSEIENHWEVWSG